MNEIKKVAIISVLLITVSAFTATAAFAADNSNAAGITTSSDSQSYSFLIVRVIAPETLTVPAGSTVTWINHQRPKLPIILVSNEGLWDDQTIYYGKHFSYTFDNPGTYTFVSKGNDDLKGTIIVTESTSQVSSTVAVSVTEADISGLAGTKAETQENSGEQAAVSQATTEVTDQKEADAGSEFLIIRMASPDSVVINAGETVTWRNLQRPKLPVVLISNDGLWEDTTIYYGKTFSYTFDTPGTYTFSAKDNSAITGTITVK